MSVLARGRLRVTSSWAIESCPTTAYFSALVLCTRDRYTMIDVSCNGVSPVPLSMTTIAQLSALSAARARLRSGFGLHARSRCHANTTTPNNTQSDQLYHDRCAVRMTHRTRRNSARRGTGNATHQFRRPIFDLVQAYGSWEHMQQEMGTK